MKDLIKKVLREEHEIINDMTSVLQERVNENVLPIVSKIISDIIIDSFLEKKIGVSNVFTTNITIVLNFSDKEEALKKIYYRIPERFISLEGVVDSLMKHELGYSKGFGDLFNLIFSRENLRGLDVKEKIDSGVIFLPPSYRYTFKSISEDVKRIKELLK
jgi:coproporphyrinogen III oxidase